MQSLLITLLLASSFALSTAGTVRGANPAPYDLKSYTFVQFLHDNQLSYVDSELPKRQALFEQEKLRILAHNNKNLGWKEGLNRFSVMTADEKHAFFGFNKRAHKNFEASVKKGKLSSVRSQLPADLKMKPVSQLPRNVDWREKGKCF